MMPFRNRPASEQDHALDHIVVMVEFQNVHDAHIEHLAPRKVQVVRALNAVVDFRIENSLPVLRSTEPQVGGPDLDAKLAPQEYRGQRSPAAQIKHPHSKPQSPLSRARRGCAISRREVFPQKNLSLGAPEYRTSMASGLMSDIVVSGRRRGMI